jgi:cobalt/nickel transport system permease protein
LRRASLVAQGGRMHIPDGFIDAGTSIGAGAVAAAGIGLCVRRTTDALDDKQVPLAGLTAAFVFAVQMLNFPVASGTSGHLLGGALAAILVGPWAGALCLGVVLLAQSLLFADGGLTALGLNTVNMALIASFGGYAVFLLVRTLVARSRTGIMIASGMAAGVSVLLAALAFTFEYALGGTGGASIGHVAIAMVGTHALIGVGEGLITAFTIGAVVAVRPDLVYGANRLMTVMPGRREPAVDIERSAA